MAITATVLDDVDEPKEIVRVVNAATTLVTHLRPDPDALLALWMCQRLRQISGRSPAKVLFVPANERGVDEDSFAIDIGTGKGVRQFGNGHCLKWSAHPEGGSSSMAVWRALPDDERLIFNHLVQAVSDADQRGENIHRIVFNKGASAASFTESVKGQVQATNMWTVHQALSNVLKDKPLWEAWSSFLDGFLLSGVMEKEAEVYAGQAKLLCDGVLAVLPHNAPQPTSKLVFERGAKVSIFSTEIGPDCWTLGVNRSAKKSAWHINLARFHDEFEALVPGIYVNPRGYLAGWTATAPLYAAREEFEKKREDLIRAVVQVIGNSKPTRG